MNNKTFWIGGLVGLVIGFLLYPVFFAGGYPRIGNTIDQHFIEQMIPHHDDAIVMANLALSKAEHQEIKTLSGNIISSQSAEIKQMEEWYRDWFKKEVPENGKDERNEGMGMMHDGMMGNQSDIKGLENAKPFDKAFIEEMIPHHQMAVMMAHMLERATDRPEMKKLAQDIIAAQTKEINEMRGWYDVWY